MAQKLLVTMARRVIGDGQTERGINLAIRHKLVIGVGKLTGAKPDGFKLV